MKKKSKCAECGQSTMSGYDMCAECCLHDDICRDERVCLICGEDMNEHLMGEAEFMEDR